MSSKNLYVQVLLLGATGRTGKLILKELIRSNYEVNCLVRDSNKIEVDTENVKVFEGTPSNVKDLETSLKGCDAVISALNISRTSDFPWAPLRTPKTFLSEVMSNLISLTEQYTIKRIVVCSAWGVAETQKDIPFWFDWTIRFSNIRFAYDDHKRQEELLKSSELNWTIVRPAGLTNGKRKSVKVSYENYPKPSILISRASVAKFMVDCLKNDALIHKAPVISG